jgi:hypothetical protein
MNFHDLIKEAEHRCLSLEDVATFCKDSVQPLDDTLDTCALELAKAYVAGTISFDTGDNLANVLFAFGAQQESLPELMFSVYLAFDAGEFYPDEIRSPSPEERFTRPQITEIVARYAAA